MRSSVSVAAWQPRDGDPARVATRSFCGGEAYRASGCGYGAGAAGGLALVAKYKRFAPCGCCTTYGCGSQAECSHQATFCGGARSSHGTVLLGRQWHSPPAQYCPAA